MAKYCSKTCPHTARGGARTDIAQVEFQTFWWVVLSRGTRIVIVVKVIVVVVAVAVIVVIRGPITGI